MQVMTINGNRFPLDAAQDLAALRESLSNAVATGGSFVEFTTRALAQVSFLVTPQSSVHLANELETEVVPVPADTDRLEAEGRFWGDDFWELA